MNKLTAEIAKRDIAYLKAFQKQPNIGISLREELYLQSLEIALPVLEQQADFYIVLNEGQPYDVFADKNQADYYAANASGLFSVLPVCAFPQPKPSTTPQIDNDGWIEWKGGDNPAAGKRIQVQFRKAKTNDAEPSEHYRWYHHQNDYDIIAYRVIENDGMEG